MAPEQLNSLDAKELHDLAQKIQTYQDARKLSDTGLVKKFPGLGSTKTYKRILGNDLVELDLEKQLTHYRCVVTLIDRLVHKAEIAVLDGDSYRLKEAKERAATSAKERAAKRRPRS